MRAFGGLNRARVLPILIAVLGASCTTQVDRQKMASSDIQSRTSPPKLQTAKEPGASTRATVQEVYGKLPLYFEANRGQTDTQVNFLSRGNGYTLFLTPTGAVLALVKTERGKEGEKEEKGDAQSATDRPQSAVLRMHLVGANPVPQVTGLEELAGKSNYFPDSDPARWRTNIPTYAKVKYQGVYPGVDLVYYGNQRQLEYDFVVAPGADPRAITLAFVGADTLEIDAQGNLILHTAGEHLRMHRPLIYQEVDGVRREISGGYVLHKILESEPRAQRVGFQIAAYDATKPLIIDPVLVYSTYLGGSHRDQGQGIAVDGAGNAYVTGWTMSANFPTKNALYPGVSGDTSQLAAFVAKLNTTASGEASLVYSTYLGASVGNKGLSIVADSTGNAYVTGSTKGVFPTTPNAFQPARPPSCCPFDVFVTKLNPTGSALLYSTFLGGSAAEEGLGIAVDTLGNAYVTGNTQSTNFPTVNAFQTTKRGGSDVFVAKLDTTASLPVYSSTVHDGQTTGGFRL